MNSKDFIQVLRKVIREEVQVAVRKELSNLNTSINEEKEPVKLTTYASTIKRTPARQKKQYTSNPMLNDILNETAGFTSEGPAVYLEESVNEINYNDFSEWPTMRRTPGPAAAPTVLTDINGNRVNANQLAQTEAGAAVINAVTKDYSALMKAIDKKKGK